MCCHAALENLAVVLWCFGKCKENLCEHSTEHSTAQHRAPWIILVEIERSWKFIRHAHLCKTLIFLFSRIDMQDLLSTAWVLPRYKSYFSNIPFPSIFPPIFYTVYSVPSCYSIWLSLLCQPFYWILGENTRSGPFHTVFGFRWYITWDYIATRYYDVSPVLVHIHLTFIFSESFCLFLALLIL